MNKFELYENFITKYLRRNIVDYSKIILISTKIQHFMVLINLQFRTFTSFSMK